LLDEAAKFNNIEVVYDALVTDIIFEEGIINLEGKTKKFDWIFATDGAWSETRKLMHDKVGFEIEEVVDSWGIQEVKIESDEMHTKYHSFFMGPTCYAVFNLSSREDGSFDGQFYMDIE
jgi:2-polyprenyl-6-methoxyphenol hydroxylase-like FAD-dependent oxidoreductase